MKNILFRVRGNNKIGMGHIVRCLALAGALQKKYPDSEIFFISEDREAAEMIGEARYKIADPKKDDLSCIKILARNGTVVVTDILYTSKKYIAELNKIKDLKVVSIDNNTRFKNINADILINANVFTGKEERKIGTAKVFLGPKYMILREEFRKLSGKKEIKDRAKNIFVISGGADKKELVFKVAKVLKNIDKAVKISFVLGSACSYVQEFREFLSAAGLNYDLLTNSNNLAEIMKKSDLAITAAGVALYELATLGVPSIVIPQAKHQEDIAYNFAKNGACINLGKYPIKGKILDETLRLIKSKKLREQLSKKSRAMVDGMGTGRVVKIISKIIK